MKLPHHNRYDYSPIAERPVYEWPNGRDSPSCSITTLNTSRFARDWGATTQPARPRKLSATTPGANTEIVSASGTILTYSTNTVLPGSHNVNSAALEEHPTIVARINARGDEYIGHGRSNAERQDSLWEADEARLIANSTAIIEQLSGKKPTGWMGPYFAQSSVPSICWWRPAIPTSWIGPPTISRSGCARARDRSSRSPIRSR